MKTIVSLADAVGAVSLLAFGHRREVTDTDRRFADGLCEMLASIAASLDVEITDPLADAVEAAVLRRDAAEAALKVVTKGENTRANFAKLIHGVLAGDDDLIAAARTWLAQIPPPPEDEGDTVAMALSMRTDLDAATKGQRER